MRKIIIEFAIGVLLLCQFVSAQSGSAMLERRFAGIDSLISSLLDSPQTRMKEIAPADSLFEAALFQYSFLSAIIRTNSKVMIVNAVSHEDTSIVKNTDASVNNWHSVPQKTMKQYHSRLVKSRGSDHVFVFWSRPIRIKNDNGNYRFGGVVAVKIDITRCCKRFGAELNEPFQVLSDGREIYNYALDSSSGFEESALNIRGLNGLTLRVRAVKNIPTSVESKKDSSDSAILLSANNSGSFVPAGVSSLKTSSNTKNNNLAGDSLVDKKVEGVSDSDITYKNIIMKMRWAGIAVIIIVFIIITVFFNIFKKRKVVVKVATDKKNASSDKESGEWHRTMAEEINREIGLQSDIKEFVADVNNNVQEEIVGNNESESFAPDATTLIDEKKVSEKNEEEIALKSVDDEDAIKENIRLELHDKLKSEIIENEINNIINSVISEVKADIRSKLEKNESEAIQAVIRQEFTDALRLEVKEKYYETFYKKELENLDKIIREKLVEKEMPSLVESHRVELSREIRAKMTAEFSGQIREHERNALKVAIVKKLQLDEYPQLMHEEREKICSSIFKNISDTETQSLEIQAREDLTSRIRTQVLNETENIHGDVRREVMENIRKKVMEEEYLSLEADIRNDVTSGIREKIMGNEQQDIHDRIVHQITESEHARIVDSELSLIIEAERKRIADTEAPALREQVRRQLKEDELEAMHNRVRTELFSETVEAIQADVEKKYEKSLEKKMADFRDQLDKKVKNELRGHIHDEYGKLVEHVELLSKTMINVDALDSLSKTIALLTEEKKKYKYFNLNSAQTESMLEYLKRVQSRFNIFLDNIDKEVKETELGINMVMKKLDSEA